MRIHTSALLAVFLIGCPDASTPTTDPASLAGSSGDDDACSEVVENILPGQDGVKVVALCTECDTGCDESGDACARYGDGCDYFGIPGICGSCCAGVRGELRCFPIE